MQTLEKRSSTSDSEMESVNRCFRSKVEKIKQELAAIASVVHEQIGYVLRDANSGEEIEHFGFRDGVSQPLFQIESRENKTRASCNCLRCPRANRLRPQRCKLWRRDRALRIPRWSQSTAVSDRK